MDIDYLISPEDFDYDDLPEWSFTVSDVEILWKPEGPYLTGDGSPDSVKIIEQVEMLINKFKDEEGETMRLGGPGLRIPTSVTSPYMVVHAVGFIYGGDDSELVFSDTAPNLYSGLNEEFDGDEEVVT
jgi:hypothetical protein